MEAQEIRLDPLAYFADSKLYRLFLGDSRGRFSAGRAAMACFLPTGLFFVVALLEGVVFNDDRDFSLLNHPDVVADLLLYPLGTFLTLWVLSQTHRVPGALRERIDLGALAAGTPAHETVMAVAQRGFVPWWGYAWLRGGLALVGAGLIFYFVYDTGMSSEELADGSENWRCLSPSEGCNARYAAFRVFTLVQWAVIGPMVAAALLVTIRTVHCLFTEVGRAGALRLSVFHPDGAAGLLPVGRLALRLNLCVSLAGLLLAIKLFFARVEPVSRTIGIMLVFPLLVAVFFGGLWAAGGALRAEKRRLERALDARYAAAEGQFRACLDDPAPDGGSLADLSSRLDQLDGLRERISKLPSWPWDFVTIGGFVAVLSSSVTAVGVPETIAEQLAEPVGTRLMKCTDKPAFLECVGELIKEP